MPRDPQKPLVSDAIRINISNRTLKARVRQALHAIDHVHRDGDLGEIEVIEMPRTPPNSSGARDAAAGGYLEGRIQLAVDAQCPCLTIVHEIGHALADMILRGKSLYFLPDVAPELKEWWQAVKLSQSYRILDGHAFRIGIPSSKDEETEVKRLTYLKKPEEIWARSYSQFVAMTCTPGRLMKELESKRRNAMSVKYGEFWADPDFGAIGRALNRILAGRRWR